jgi:Clr5-like protein
LVLIIITSTTFTGKKLLLTNSEQEHSFNMPREYIDLEPYKNEIVALFNNDNTIDAIALRLRTRHQLQVQSRTIKRRLRAWGVRKLNPATTTDSALHDRIKVLFFEAGLEEGEMLAALTADALDFDVALKEVPPVVLSFADTDSLQPSQRRHYEDLVSGVQPKQMVGSRSICEINTPPYLHNRPTHFYFYSSIFYILSSVFTPVTIPFPSCLKTLSPPRRMSPPSCPFFFFFAPLTAYVA